MFSLCQFRISSVLQLKQVCLLELLNSYNFPSNHFMDSMVVGKSAKVLAERLWLGLMLDTIVITCRSILLLFRVLWKISSYSRLFNTGICSVHILEFCVLANSYIVSSGFQNTYKSPQGCCIWFDLNSNWVLVRWGSPLGQECLSWRKIHESAGQGFLWNVSCLGCLQPFGDLRIWPMFDHWWWRNQVSTVLHCSLSRCSSQSLQYW
jgi:hypothetical protein